jgi:hypothetical protein
MLQRENVDVEDTAERGPSATEEELDTIAEKEKSEGETLKVENDLGADEWERSEGETLKVENDLGADEREKSEGETLKLENDLGADEREVTLVQQEKRLGGGIGEDEERDEKKDDKREVYHMHRHQKCSFSTGGIPWRWFRLPTCGCLQWSHQCPPKLPGTTSFKILWMTKTIGGTFWLALYPRLSLLRAMKSSTQPRPGAPPDWPWRPPTPVTLCLVRSDSGVESGTASAHPCTTTSCRRPGWSWDWALASLPGLRAGRGNRVRRTWGVGSVLSSHVTWKIVLSQMFMIIWNKMLCAWLTFWFILFLFHYYVTVYADNTKK